MEPVTLFRAGFLLIGSTVLVGMITGITLWVRWFLGHRQRNLCGDGIADTGGDLITRLPQPFPRWSVLDFIFCFGVMLSLGAYLQLPGETTVSREGDAAFDATELDATEQTDEPAQKEVLTQQIRVHFIANVAAFGATLALLQMAFGASLSHLSLIPTRADLRRGSFAAVWILTPVLLLNVVVSNLVQYEHKVMDLLNLESGVTTFFALFLSAAIVTPIVEEFQFRLLLQGGLQKIAHAGREHASNEFYQPGAAWPIYVTSLIFAMMHLGQGAAPIPLFFLSVGLGYLYQRTGRLVPTILIHMLLNAMTLLMEFCRVNASIGV